jgi:hypothetical protein
MATYFENDDEVTRSQVIDFIDRIIRLTEPDAGEGTELHGLPEGFSTEPAVKERGVLVAPTPDTTEATLDHIAWAQHARSEHEATHGEAEQCGEACIVLGLAEFDDEEPA